MQTVAENRVECVSWNENQVLDLGPDVRFCDSEAGAGPCRGEGDELTLGWAHRGPESPKAQSMRSHNGWREEPTEIEERI